MSDTVRDMDDWSPADREGRRMRRIRIHDGLVHFSGANGHTLCGRDCLEDNLFDESESMAEATPEPVTCRDCSTLYCKVKNAPWNEVSRDAMDEGMSRAVTEDA